MKVVDKPAKTLQPAENKNNCFNNGFIARFKPNIISFAPVLGKPIGARLPLPIRITV